MLLISSRDLPRLYSTFAKWLAPVAPLFSILLPATVFILLASRRLFDESIGYPDADRILMDGVFLADFIRALPVSDPLGFALTYYAQYPALSIGYRPAFFPAVEALFILVFGVHVWAGRLAVIFLCLLGGAALYRLVVVMYGRWVAFITLMLLATTPFVVWWSWYTMAELPVLAMLMIAAYFVWRYVELGRSRHALLAALTLAFAVWTKQTAIFALLWFGPFVLIYGWEHSLLRKRATWLALLLCVLLSLPVVLMTLYLGDLNLAQSVGENVRGAQLPRYHIETLLSYPRLLATSQLASVSLLMVVLGFALALGRLDRRTVFFLLSVFATFLFFTSLNDPHVARYTIFWLPGLYVLAVVPVTRAKGALRAVLLLLLWVAIGQNLWLSVRQMPQFVGGFKEAAAVAMAVSPGPVLLVDAWNNGYFTFFVRALDPERRYFVLRGDKLLTSSAVESTTFLQMHARSAEDVRSILDQHSVNVLVVEADNYTGLDIHSTLREIVAGRDFVLRDRIPIISRLPRYQHQDLLVYEYTSGSAAPAGTLILKLPIVGKELHVPADGSRPELRDIAGAMK